MASRAEPEEEERAARIIQRKFREHVELKRDLSEDEKHFIRPWCKRWRTKSIFQVLLLYRAERLQALANFCLQIHLYNQDFLTCIRRTRDEIYMKDINTKAEPAEYLPPLKPVVPKLPLMWANSITRGNVPNCEPLPKFDIERLESEIRARQAQEERHKNFEDKEIQTSFSKEVNHLQNEVEPTSSLTIKEPNDDKSPSELQTQIFNSGLVEETKPIMADDSKPPALNVNDVTEENTPICGHKLYTLPPPVKSTRNNLKGNFNREFSISINEMEEKFRNKDYKANGDDPPFNFRAVLRKTNPSAQSRKSLVNEEFDFRTEIRNFNFSERKLSAGRGQFGTLRRPSETIKIEIAPGIIIWGKMADL